MKNLTVSGYADVHSVRRWQKDGVKCLGLYVEPKNVLYVWVTIELNDNTTVQPSPDNSYIHVTYNPK